MKRIGDIDMVECNIIAKVRNIYAKEHGYCLAHKQLYCFQENVCGVAPIKVNNSDPVCHECKSIIPVNEIYLKYQEYYLKNTGTKDTIEPHNFVKYYYKFPEARKE